MSLSNTDVAVCFVDLVDVAIALEPWPSTERLGKAHVIASSSAKHAASTTYSKHNHQASRNRFILPWPTVSNMVNIRRYHLLDAIETLVVNGTIHINTAVQRDGVRNTAWYDSFPMQPG